MDYLSDESFKTKKLSDITDGPTEFEACVFTNCDFSDSDLSDYKFIECEFKDCDLSNVKVSHAMFNDIQFGQCKMLGIQFDTCKEFGFAIRCKDCQIDHSVFYQMDLKRSHFENCHAHGIDLTEADLTNVSLAGSDLADAMFERTILEGTDLREAVNYHLDPDNNRIRGAKFSQSGISGLLSKYGIEIYH